MSHDIALVKIIITDSFINVKTFNCNVNPKLLINIFSK